MNVQRPSRGGCPDASELAAFSEGRLDAKAAAAVERHVLRCPECSDVMAAIARTYSVEAPARTSVARSPWVAMAAGLMLAILGGWAGFHYWDARHASTADIASLVKATGARRFFEPRLSGGFAWAPLPDVRGGSVEPGGRAVGSDRWEIAAVAARLHTTQEGDGPASEAHALGVAHLLLGSAAEAVPILERAAEDAPDDAGVLSDLAAALIERGRTPEHAQDVVRALDCAERAVVLAPGLLEARFNRALALERLGVREAALQAWEDYLKADSSSEWAGEARARVERLRQVSGVRRFSDDAAEFATACGTCDAARVEVLVRLHPQEATELLTSELGHWAELSLAGDARASAVFDSASCGATVVTRVVGDPLLENAVTEIRAAARGRDATRRLALAHQALKRGRAMLDDARAEEANALLVDAVGRFKSLHSPFADFAELYRLSSAYYLGTSGRFRYELSAFAARFPETARRIVGARAHWFLGTVEDVSGRTTQALTALASASAGLDALGFVADATFVRSIEAEQWWTLGRSSRAWEMNRAVLEQLDALPDARRAQALVTEVANEAELEGDRFAALTLQQAAIVFASRHDTAMDQCEGLVWYARVAERANRPAIARQAATDARASLVRVQDPKLRGRLDAQLSLVEARLELPADARRSLDAANRAVSWFESVQKEDQFVEAYTLRAEAKERVPDPDGASSDYLLALQTAERQRDLVSDAPLKTSFFDTKWELAREMVRFEVARGDPRRALMLADRIRASSTGESKAGRSAQPAEPIDALLKQLGPDQAVVSFTVLSDRTLVFVLYAGAFDITQISVSERELDRSVEAVRRSLNRMSMTAVATASGQTLEILLASLRARLRKARTVVIVPDGCLHRVPWGALRDPQSGRLWNEDAAVAVAPSLQRLLGRRPRGDEPTDYRAVIVGDPQFDRALYPGLQPLPGAAQEARAIESLYRNATVLTGPAATPDKMLDASSRAQILHVAAHALLNGIDPELSTIALAPGGTIAPSGGLAPHDIRGHDMRNLRLVVLAACRSGDGPMSRIEGPLSLARPFLTNGARAIVVSLWDLPDATGATIMRSLHQKLLAGASPLEALNRAERECWATPDPDPRTCAGLQLILNEPIGG